MGQKVHPRANRLGILYGWDGQWYAKENYRKLLLEDLVIRKKIREVGKAAGISHIVIEKTPNHVHIKIICGKPGVIIGRSGAGVDMILKKVTEQLEDLKEKKETRQVNISVEEVPKVDVEAQLVAENIASQLEKRVSYRRAMKQALRRTMRAGALGIRTECAGRLVGADMARRAWYLEGRVPLHTFSADVDYGFCEAKTKSGKIGVKVWINRGLADEENE